jgi:hypothetical protein
MCIATLFFGFNNEKLNMGNITMPEVEQATHLGIVRTTTMKHNIQTNITELSTE